MHDHQKDNNPININAARASAIAHIESRQTERIIEGMRLLRTLADIDVSAMFEYGMALNTQLIYLKNGQNLDTNENNWLFWVRKAAALQYVPALLEMGYYELYGHDKSPLRIKEKADKHVSQEVMNYFLRAADQESPSAYLILARIYSGESAYQNLNIPINKDYANELLTKGSDLGDEQCTHELILHLLQDSVYDQNQINNLTQLGQYQRFHRIVQNIDTLPSFREETSNQLQLLSFDQKKFIDRAFQLAQKGNLTAKELLARWFLNSPDIQDRRDAISLLRELAEHHNISACSTLIDLYLEGDPQGGCPADIKESLHFARKLENIAPNNPQVSMKLASIYIKMKYNREAIQCLYESLKRGNPEAGEKLAEIKENLLKQKTYAAQKEHRINDATFIHLKDRLISDQVMHLRDSVTYPTGAPFTPSWLKLADLYEKNKKIEEVILFLCSYPIHLANNSESAAIFRKIAILMEKVPNAIMSTLARSISVSFGGAEMPPLTLNETERSSVEQNIKMSPGEWFNFIIEYGIRVPYEVKSDKDTGNLSTNVVKI